MPEESMKAAADQSSYDIGTPANTLRNAVRDESPVQIQHNRISRALDVLEISLATHTEKIEGVLTNVPESTNTRADSGINGSSSLLLSLDRYADRIEAAAARLQTITNRVEL